MGSEADKIRRVSENTRFAPYARRQNDQIEADSKSIYVGNVEYKSTEDDLRLHFASCGTVVRVTVMKDRFTGHPKGFAYIQFDSKEEVTKALELSGSLLNGRQITVAQKRTNLHCMRRGMAPRPPVKFVYFHASNNFNWHSQ